MKKLLFISALALASCTATKPTTFGTTITGVSVVGNQVIVDGTLSFKNSNVDSTLNAIKNVITLSRVTTDTAGVHHTTFHIITPVIK